MKLLPIKKYLKVLKEDCIDGSEDSYIVNPMIYRSFHVHIDTPQSGGWEINIYQNYVEMIQQNDYVLLNGVRIPMATSHLSLRLTFKLDDNLDLNLNEMVYVLRDLALSDPEIKFTTRITTTDYEGQVVNVATCEGCKLLNIERTLIDTRSFTLTLSTDHFTSYNGIGLPFDINENIINYGHGEA